MNHYAYKLVKEILALSNSTRWTDAKKEWMVIDCSNEPNECICTHDIVETFLIQNMKNGNCAIVGNECVKRFKETSMIEQQDAVRVIKCNVCHKELKTPATYKNHLLSKSHIAYANIKRCIDCNCPLRNAPEWKKRCLDCYYKSKST